GGVQEARGRSVPSPHDVLFSSRSRCFDTGNWSAKLDHGDIARREMVTWPNLLLFLPQPRLNLGSRAHENARYLKPRFSLEQQIIVLVAKPVVKPRSFLRALDDNHSREVAN